MGAYMVCFALCNILQSVADYVLDGAGILRQPVDRHQSAAIAERVKTSPVIASPCENNYHRQCALTSLINARPYEMQIQVSGI